MIFRNDNGFPMSVNDTMDSAVRISILCLRKDVEREDVVRLLRYEKDGVIVRCPEMAPANNPNNATRDQLKMLIAAFGHIGRHDVVRRIFWAHARRFFFCQNSERDKEGSKKYPWPHYFFKDSKPTNQTWHFWDKVFVPTKEAERIHGYEIEKKNFDFRDPLGPNDIWQMIVAGRMKWLYWFKPFGMFFHKLAVKNRTEGEFNQMIAECTTLGTLHLLNENWKTETIAYWKVRDEIEYSRYLIEFVESNLKN